MRPLRALSLLLSLSLSGCSLCPPAWLSDRLTPPIPTCQVPAAPAAPIDFAALATAPFMAFGGGGAPHYNEIALEKNIRYFQRSLALLDPQPPNPSPDRSPTPAALFFANGNDGQATLRYLNPIGLERFKSPEIDGLQGPATATNLYSLFDAIAQTAATDEASRQPLFFYFTGHGLLTEENPDNNTFILWQEDLISVQDFTTRLDRFPPKKPVVVMMAQCYSGAFANLIYEGGDPSQPVALQSRCGFFAITQDLPSVGCTPEVNEADYRDYSSSFFAGLTGIDRVGQPVPSADYNRDGPISYAEAHAFAKIDGVTSDRPISTLEAWLQRQIDPEIAAFILSKPLQQWQASARPERAIVIDQLSQKLNFAPSRSWLANINRWQPKDEVEAAYVERLRMELINVAAEKIVQAQPQQRLIMQRLMDCEGGVPGKMSLAAQGDSVGS